MRTANRELGFSEALKRVQVRRKMVSIKAILSMAQFVDVSVVYVRFSERRTAAICQCHIVY